MSLHRLALAAFLLCLAAAPARAADPLLPEAERRLVKEHCPFGLPSTGELLFRRGYVEAHNNWLKIPAWVAYHLPREKVKGDTERARKFTADPELKPFQRSEDADYKGSGFDRGHMAPAADMKTDEEEMAESFLLSNVTPQVGKGFNRGVWKKLEDRVRRWAEERGEVWVITGPVIVPAETDSEGRGLIQFQIIGRHRVAVPTHFFKIVYSRGAEDELHVIAFLFPNAPASGDAIREAVTSVDTIEDYTGLDFFNTLDEKLQESVESARAPDLESW